MKIIGLVLLAYCSLNSSTTLYNTISPDSLFKQLAYYSLYPKTSEGKKALLQSYQIINKHRHFILKPEHINPLMQLDINAIVSLFLKQSSHQILPKKDIQMLKFISNHLKHRTRKGYAITTFNQVRSLSEEEIDIARALFLYSENDLSKVESYEALLDLMALHISGTFNKNASLEEKIQKMNHFLFIEMNFTFPPHSLWPKNIDTYTFLSSVLDNREGVCLGVSVLYLSLAQRLGIPIDIYTPPGHIFLACPTPTKRINIETTFRGNHLPSKRYLSLECPTLEKRTKRETIGCYLMNLAATQWQYEHYDKAEALYEKAIPFVSDDPKVYFFLAIQKLGLKKEKEAIGLFKKSKSFKDLDLLLSSTIDDYLNNKVSFEGLKIMFEHVDDKRPTIVNKQNKLLKILEEYPQFRQGWYHLAVTYMQLNKLDQAYSHLQRCHQFFPTHPTFLYYLTEIALQQHRVIDAFCYYSMLYAQRSKLYIPPAIEALDMRLRLQNPVHYSNMINK